MAITKQDVWRVANEINAGGEKPSAVEVRKRLGTGSYTTITAALKEWVEPEASDGDELAPVPAEFEDRIVQAGADLFAIAMRIAGEQFQAERDAWAAERAQIEAERDEAIRLADAVTADLDEMRETVRRLQAENAAIVEERAKAYAIAEERARTAQTAREEADASRGMSERLKGRIEALEAVIERLQPTTHPEKPTAKKAKTGNGDKSSARTDPSVTNPEG